MKIYEDRYLVLKEISAVKTRMSVKVSTTLNKSEKKAIGLNSDAPCLLSECNHPEN